LFNFTKENISKKSLMFQRKKIIFFFVTHFGIINSDLLKESLEFFKFIITERSATNI